MKKILAISSLTGERRLQGWGWSATAPVPADYDGDGLTDIAAYHPATGDWSILESTTGELRPQPWGWSAAEPVLPQYQINKFMGISP